MVAAGDELGAVLERHPVGRLDAGPVGEHVGDRKAAVAAYTTCAVDRVADAQMGQRLGPSCRNSG